MGYSDCSIFKYHSLAMVGLLLLSACGGGSGGSGVQERSGTGTGNTNTGGTSAPKQEVYVPNYANRAQATIYPDEACRNSYCMDIKNGRDELQLRIILNEFIIYTGNADLRKINGKYAEYADRGLGVISTTVGKTIYISGVYPSGERTVDGNVFQNPSGYYTGLDLTDQMKIEGYKGAELIPINRDASWTWSNVFSQVAVRDEQGQKNVIKDENGTITLHPDQTWVANFAQGDLILDGQIDRQSRVEGTATFTYQGEKMQGGFIGGDGVNERGRLDTGGVFAGNNEAGSVVFAGNWYNEEYSNFQAD